MQKADTGEEQHFNEDAYGRPAAPLLFSPAPAYASPQLFGGYGTAPGGYGGVAGGWYGAGASAVAAGSAPGSVPRSGAPPPAAHAPTFAAGPLQPGQEVSAVSIPQSLSPCF